MYNIELPSNMPMHAQGSLLDLYRNPTPYIKMSFYDIDN